MGLKKYRIQWQARIQELEKKFAESGSEEDKALLEKCQSNFRGDVNIANVLLSYGVKPDITRSNSDFFLNPRFATISE